MARIPFTLPDVGLKEVKGLVFVDSGQLVVRIEASYLGMIDADKEELRLDPGELDDLEIKSGLFRDRLVITPWDIEVLDRIPGLHSSTLDLRIWRKHRSDLRKLVDDFERIVR